MPSSAPVMTTALMVQAAMAMANRSLVSCVLIRRGDHDNGAVLVRLDHPDGSASLESRVLNFDGGYDWTVVMGDPPCPTAEVDARIEKELSFDPDCWVLAIDSAVGDNPLKAME